MANTVYEVVELELLDSSTVTVRPLSIKNLKKFNAVIRGLQAEDMDEETATDIFVAAGVVCMEQLRPDLADPDKFQEIVDIQTMMKVLEKAGGLVTNSPNLVATDLDLGTI